MPRVVSMIGTAVVVMATILIVIIATMWILVPESEMVRRVARIILWLVPTDNLLTIYNEEWKKIFFNGNYKRFRSVIKVP